MSEAQELEAGRTQYAPSRQMQGGDYRLDPALTTYVNEVGQRLAKVSDRSLPYEFQIINDSTPNAWALPGGKIAVNRGLLLELENEAELAAVLGHEIVHAAARHGAKGMERGLLLQGAVLAAGVAAGGSDYANLAVGAASLGAGLISQRYSREAELEADEYGIRYMVRAGYDPMAAVRLQEVFVRLAQDQRQDWLSGLFASHPPSQERVENNRRLVAALKVRGGMLGEERYRHMTAPLMSSKRAYEAYEEGRKALGKKRTQEALNLAEEAIRIEPREALFYGLRGDVRFEQGHYRQAEQDYDKAMQRDPAFFRHPLRRGLVREKLGDRTGAEQDLQASLKLLPTATAYYGLGRLALDGGQRRQAKDFFGKAAGSASTDGREAEKAFLRLDLQDNVGRYLAAVPVQDQSGRLAIRIRNGSKYSLRDVRVELFRRGTYRRSGAQQLFRVRGRLSAGEVVMVNTGIGPLGRGEKPADWVVRPLDAQLVE